MSSDESKKTIAKNIKEYMERKDVSKQQLCDDLGFKYTTFLDWINAVTYPRIGKIEAMARYFGCEKSDLIEEHRESGGLTPEELSLVQKYRRLDNDGQYMVDTVIGVELERCERPAPMGKILYYDLPASAGTGNYLETEYPTYIEIPQEEIPHGADFAVRIAGDSMEPDFFGGDVVFVKRGEVRRGDVGIFVINDEGYIKELGDGVLISRNKKYTDIKIGENDSQYILGKVVGKL